MPVRTDVTELRHVFQAFSERPHWASKHAPFFGENLNHSNANHVRFFVTGTIQLARHGGALWVRSFPVYLTLFLTPKQ